MAANNDAVNESLSALLDSEHSELDLRRILKAAENDEAVATKWASYQTTRQVIKKELDLQCEPGFLAGIQQAIADESVPTPLTNRSIWQRYAGKVAVAACFTFVFLIGANQWSQNNDVEPAAALAADVDSAHQPAAVVPDGFELPPLTARTVSSVPSSNPNATSNFALPMRAQGQGTEQARLQEVMLTAEQQALLERMMLKHADAAAANGGLGVMPYTRVNTSEASE